MRKIAVLVLAVCAIALPRVTFACSCAPYPEDPAQAISIAFARADVVFLGVVTSIKTQRWRRPIGVRDATFEVREAWKGLSGRNPATVRSAIGSIACGYKFSKRGEYLVFAYWDVDSQILTTNMCELTRKASEADVLIRELDKIAGSGSKSTP